MDIVQNIELALVFALIGIVVFVVSFVVIDRLTPYDLWREIVQEKSACTSNSSSRIRSGGRKVHMRRACLCRGGSGFSPNPPNIYKNSEASR